MMTERNDLIPQIEAMYKKYGGVLDPEFNQFGIRNPENQNKDIFNDTLGIYLPKEKKVLIYTGTTDPGTSCTFKKSGGAAHMCEGFHKDIWVLEIHAKISNPKFAHEAFCQRPEHETGPVKIWRDVNKNYIEDDNVYQSGNWFGINKHRASKLYVVHEIDDYSWGCIVAQDAKDHEKEVEIAKQTQKYKKDKFCKFSFCLGRLDSDIKL